VAILRINPLRQLSSPHTNGYLAPQSKEITSSRCLATNTAGIGVAVILPRRPKCTDMAKLRVIPIVQVALGLVLTMFSTAGVQLSAVGAIFHSCAVALGQHPAA